MGKTNVSLHVEGFKMEREVTMVTYSFNRATDKEGQVTGIPRGGKITIKVKAITGSNSTGGMDDMPEWMIMARKPKNGHIEFRVPGDDDKLMKKIEFKDAYCVDFREFWEDKTADAADAEFGHYEEIVISCKEIIINSVRYTNDWA